MKLIFELSYVVLVYNGTLGLSDSNTTQQIYTETILTHVKMQLQGRSFKIAFTTLTKRSIEKTFLAVGPMLI